MITIRKGNKTLSIPAGAYKMYALSGWVAEGEKKAEPVVEPEAPEVEEEVEPEEELEEEVEYVDPEELKERPLSELDFQELQILAEDLGIDIQGIKSSKTLRAKIKERL